MCDMNGNGYPDDGMVDVGALVGGGIGIDIGMDIGAIGGGGSGGSGGGIEAGGIVAPYEVTGGGVIDG